MELERRSPRKPPINYPDPCIIRSIHHRLAESIYHPITTALLSKYRSRSARSGEGEPAMPTTTTSAITRRCDRPGGGSTLLTDGLEFLSGEIAFVLAGKKISEVPGPDQVSVIP
ncbi:hypothetical protein NQZ68_030737 [Dissostichus eleginoides]|nr:hypothetical protein NQZ68_030737 [Dissostichus eleginoides]